MFGSIQRSFNLVKVCWRVLRLDKELMLFPLISFLVLIPVELSYFGIGIGLDLFGAGDSTIGWIILFLYYVVSYFIIIFFNSGLIYAARIRMQGGNPTLRDGLNGALQRLPQIFLWALVSATVSIILRVIERRFGIVGRMISGLFGMAWGLGTYFVVPVLVVEGISPIKAIKRSAALFKNTWGELVFGNFGLGLAALLVIVLWLVISVVLVAVLIAALGSVGVIMAYV